MANAGNDPNTFHGTNGSQFFITDGRPRHLDFVHTIFGQMTHGWKVLPLLAATPRGTTGTSTDRPTTNVTITSASVATQYTGPGSDGHNHTFTDAVLLLSADRPGTSTITLRSGTTTATFTATAVKDTVNSPPFFMAIDDLMTKAEQITIPFRLIDLEFDHVDLGAQLLNNTTTYQVSSASGGSTTQFSSKANITPAPAPGELVLTGNPVYRNSSSAGVPYTGPLSPLLQAAQWHPGSRPGYDPTPPSIDANEPPTVSIGTPPVIDKHPVLTGAPGTALSNAVVARFQDDDRLARPAGYQAVINWGDGSNVSAQGTVNVSSSPGGYHEFTVTATNTYARAGIYPLVVTLYGPGGWHKELRGTAIITTNSLVATPLPIEVASAAITQRGVATFTDSNQPGPASAYTAAIDWGDGMVSAGLVQVNVAGHYTVAGAHTYADPRVYSYTVRVHKQGLAAASDAVVWSRLVVSGFASMPHSPPFSQAHVTGLFSAITPG